MSLPSARTLRAETEAPGAGTAAVILKRSLQHPRHFKGGGGRSRDGQDGVAVEFDHLVGAIVHDDVARRGAAISRDDDAVLVVKGKDRRRLGLHGRRGGAERFRHGGTMSADAKQFGEVAAAGVGDFRAAAERIHWPVRWR